MGGQSALWWAWQVCALLHLVHGFVPEPQFLNVQGRSADPASVHGLHIVDGRGQDAGTAPGQSKVNRLTYQGCYMRVGNSAANSWPGAMSFSSKATPEECAAQCGAGEVWQGMVLRPSECWCLPEIVNLSPTTPGDCGTSTTWAGYGSLSASFSSLTGYSGGAASNVYTLYKKYVAVSIFGGSAYDSKRALLFQAVVLRGNSGENVYSVHASQASGSWLPVFPYHSQVPGPLQTLGIVAAAYPGAPDRVVGYLLPTSTEAASHPQVAEIINIFLVPANSASLTQKTRRYELPEAGPPRRAAFTSTALCPRTGILFGAAMVDPRNSTNATMISGLSVIADAKSPSERPPNEQLLDLFLPAPVARLAVAQRQPSTVGSVEERSDLWALVGDRLPLQPLRLGAAGLGRCAGGIVREDEALYGQEKAIYEDMTPRSNSLFALSAGAGMTVKNINLDYVPSAESCAAVSLTQAAGSDPARGTKDALLFPCIRDGSTLSDIILNPGVPARETFLVRLPGYIMVYTSEALVGDVPTSVDVMTMLSEEDAYCGVCASGNECKFLIGGVYLRAGPRVRLLPKGQDCSTATSDHPLGEINHVGEPLGPRSPYYSPALAIASYDAAPSVGMHSLCYCDSTDRLDRRCYCNSERCEGYEFEIGILKVEGFGGGSGRLLTGNESFVAQPRRLANVCGPPPFFIRYEVTTVAANRCNNLHSGMSCAVQCQDGYSIMEPWICDRGLYTNSPRCISKTCNNPSHYQVREGFRVRSYNDLTHCHNLPHNFQCTLPCKPGFYKTGDFLCTRGILGDIVNMLPTCIGLPCTGSPPRVPHMLGITNSPRHWSCPNVSSYQDSPCPLNRDQCTDLRHGESCDILCDEGFHPVSNHGYGNNKIRCSGTQYLMPSCVRNNCYTIPEKILHGDPNFDPLSCNDTANLKTCPFQCAEGYDKVGELTCKDASWIKPFCNPKPCLFPPRVISSETRASTAAYAIAYSDQKLEERLKLEGYKTKGEVMNYPDGSKVEVEWPNEQGGKPLRETVENHLVQIELDYTSQGCMSAGYPKEGYAHGSRCELRCKNPRWMRPTDSFICLLGNFSSVQPKCVPYERCPPYAMPSPEDRYVVSGNFSNTSHGATRNVSCASGTEQWAQGEPTPVPLWAKISCSDPGFGDGRWLPSEIPFSCEEPRCRKLELPQNASSFANCSLESEFHSPGTVCEIVCAPGFGELGKPAPVMACQTGKWHLQPSSLADACPFVSCVGQVEQIAQLPLVTGVYCDSEDGLRPRFGETCVLACEEGYEPTGSYTCTDNGGLQFGLRPELVGIELRSFPCHGKECFVPELPKAIEVGNDGTHCASMESESRGMAPGDICQLHCKPGYSGGGLFRCIVSLELEPLDSSVWDCAPSSCGEPPRIRFSRLPNPRSESCTFPLPHQGTCAKIACESGYTLRGAFVCEYGKYVRAPFCVPEGAPADEQPVVKAGLRLSVEVMGRNPNSLAIDLEGPVLYALADFLQIEVQQIRIITLEFQGWQDDVLTRVFKNKTAPNQVSSMTRSARSGSNSTIPSTRRLQNASDASNDSLLESTTSTTTFTTTTTTTEFSLRLAVIYVDFVVVLDAIPLDGGARYAAALDHGSVRKDILRLQEPVGAANLAARIADELRADDAEVPLLLYVWLPEPPIFVEQQVVEQLTVTTTSVPPPINVDPKLGGMVILALTTLVIMAVGCAIFGYSGKECCAHYLQRLRRFLMYIQGFIRGEESCNPRKRKKKNAEGEDDKKKRAEAEVLPPDEEEDEVDVDDQVAREIAIGDTQLEDALSKIQVVLVG